MPDKRKTVPCPHCGELISGKAEACPYCGSDEQTGWSERTYLDGIDVGDEIDYDEMVRSEFPDSAPPIRKKISWKVYVGAIVLFFFLAAILKMVL